MVKFSLRLFDVLLFPSHVENLAVRAPPDPLQHLPPFTSSSAFSFMNPISTETIQSFIIEIRSLRVLLDSDVARIYGVDTKRINEAVKNNPEKFPEGYIIRLTGDELRILRSKFSTAKLSKTRVTPTAFPERGLYMLATILKSAKATQATFGIIETFAKIRELSSTIKALSVVKDDAKQKSLMQRSGEIVSEIFDEELQTSDTETSIELNFAVLKFKHTIKRKK